MNNGFPSEGYSPYVIQSNGCFVEQSYEDYLISKLKEVYAVEQQPYIETELDKLLKRLWKVNYDINIK